MLTSRRFTFSLIFLSTSTAWSQISVNQQTGAVLSPTPAIAAWDNRQQVSGQVINVGPEQHIVILPAHPHGAQPSICYTMQMYRFARPSPESDSLELVEHSTCASAKQFELKAYH